MSQPTTPFTRADLINAINDALDIPVIREETEGELIEKALGHIIDYIPVALWPIIADSAKGIDIETIRRFADALTRIIADNMDTPWIPHSVRMTLISGVMNMLVERAQQGLALPHLAKLLPQS